MKIAFSSITFATLLVLTLVATSLNVANAQTNSEEINDVRPLASKLVTKQRLIVTTASKQKMCGALAGDSAKKPVCVPDASAQTLSGVADQVIATNAISCAHDRDHGGWLCWGDDAFYAPFDLSILKDAKPQDVFAGESNVCVKSEHEVDCVSRTEFTKGPYAIETEGEDPIANPKTRKFGPFNHVLQAAASSDGLCAIDGNDVKCEMTTVGYGWPQNLTTVHPRLIAMSEGYICVVDDNGLLCTPQNSLMQTIKRPDWKAAVSLHATASGVCALLPSGQIACEDRYAQNTNNNSGIDVKIAMPKNLSGLVEYDASSFSSCALTSAGAVTCWGAISRNYGVPPTLKKALRMSVADQHICAISETGDVVCWGNNAHGQTSPPLKAGSQLNVALTDVEQCTWNKSGASCRVTDDYDQYVLTSLPVLNDVVAFALPTTLASANACAIDKAPDGSTKIVCWGDSQNLMSPPKVPNPVMISSTGEEACAASPDGQITCWGTKNFEDTPNKTTGLRKLEVSASTACAVDSYGLMCWKSTTSPNPKLDPPASLRLDGAVTDVALTNHQGCALTFDHAVQCWGDGDTRVPPLQNVVGVFSIGENTMCATDDNGVTCWGDIKNLPGQTGARTSGSRIPSRNNARNLP